ncbi:MAG: protoheme IX farnesyltransferase [Deltaproteobacteria bacterium]|nr:protoheme IX farnesyltransferase [Deltaproteobacteria bacterium]
MEPVTVHARPVAGRESRSDGVAASALLISKPGIAGGVTLAGFSGMVLAGRSLPPAGFGFICLSCILMAASGSAILNGILDREMDSRMSRVAARKAALENVGSRGALFLSLGLIAASLAISVLFLNPTATLLLLGAVSGYALLYTLYLKRRSPYGTVPGGIPGALPVLIGYASIEPRIGADGFLLFFLMLLWQPPHFWTLALKCQDDYRAAGVPVLPVAMGEPYTKILVFLYATALLPLSLGLWWLGFCSPHFAAAALFLGAWFLVSCYRNIVASRRFGKAFAASIIYILGLLLSVIVDVAAG